MHEAGTRLHVDVYMYTVATGEFAARKGAVALEFGISKNNMIAASITNFKDGLLWFYMHPMFSMPAVFLRGPNFLRRLFTAEVFHLNLSFTWRFFSIA